MQTLFKQSKTASCSINDVSRPSISKAGSISKASGRAVSWQPKIGSRCAKRKKIHWPPFLFLLALVVPWLIFIGTLRLSVYRIVLLVMVWPCLGMWMAGKAGRIRTTDIAVLLFWFWCSLSIIVRNGIVISIQPLGVLLIETLGPYLLARCYIRDADDFYNVVQLMFRIVVFLSPFAIVEFISGQNISRESFALILPTLHEAMPARLGLTRVQSVFDHPILFGLCTGGILGLVHLVLGYRQSFFQRTLRAGIVGVTGLLSLSSGPMFALIAQGLLLLWNSLLRTSKARWKILIALLVLINLTVLMFSNRSLPTIVSNNIALDEQTYWFRTLIWTYGSASALNHPLFGVGMNEWERPAWMGPSIDNLWLFLAVQFGLPAVFFLALALLSIFLAVGFKREL